MLTLLQTDPYNGVDAVSVQPLQDLGLAQCL